MVCVCGHNKDKHESGRDYGYHGYKCAEFNCKCTTYINQSRRLENDPRPEDFQRWITYY